MKILYCDENLPFWLMIKVYHFNGLVMALKSLKHTDIGVFGNKVLNGNGQYFIDEIKNVTEYYAMSFSWQNLHWSKSFWRKKVELLPWNSISWCDILW